MTSLIAWAAVDSRAISSLNFASDSRISWIAQHKIIGNPWDHTKKIFASLTTSDIFGFCGDSIIASNILGQFTDIPSVGGIPTAIENPQETVNALARMIEKSITLYPDDRRNPFTIIHGARIGTGKEAAWNVFRLDCDGTTCAAPSIIPMPSESEVIIELGSGKEYIHRFQNKWRESEVGGTSRAIFSAFCDAIASGEDRFSGGPVQFCRLLRKDVAKPIGIIWNGERYVSGASIPPTQTMQAFDWFNSLFEWCDPITLLRLPKAQPQPRPRKLVK